MKQLIFQALKTVLELIERAVDGDDDAARRLQHVLDDTSKSQLASERAKRMRERIPE